MERTTPKLSFEAIKKQIIAYNETIRPGQEWLHISSGKRVKIDTIALECKTQELVVGYHFISGDGFLMYDYTIQFVREITSFLDAFERLVDYPQGLTLEEIKLIERNRRENIKKKD